VVYNPIMEEMFTAVKGGGAKLNGKPIHCNNSEDLKHCLIGTGFPYDRSDETLDWVLGNVKVILKNCRAVRRAGSAALDMCYVAKGSLDIYYERGVHAWDIAAGTIICQEAGAVVLDPYGEHDSIDVCGGRVICGNPVVVPKLAALIKPPPAKGNH
jgi:myo-inositol-1(or 4)-monophosphatase